MIDKIVAPTKSCLPRRSGFSFSIDSDFKAFNLLTAEEIGITGGDGGFLERATDAGFVDVFGAPSRRVLSTPGPAPGSVFSLSSAQSETFFGGISLHLERRT